VAKAERDLAKAQAAKLNRTIAVHRLQKEH
jgi:hypothetical protein